MIKIHIEEKKYDDKILLLDTNINISEGDFISIKGESGIGKTTLLSIIGLLESFTGSYYFFGKLINNRNKIRKENFAYVFQKPYLIDYLNVYQNILMPLKNLKLDKKLDDNFIDEVTELLNIKSLLNRYPNNLSGGEALRVSICRAILSRRKIILCDEPTGSLDPKNAKIVMDMLSELNKKYNLTIIVVTHSDIFDNYFNNNFKIVDKRIIGC